MELGTETVYDPEIIYGLVPGLQLSPRSVNINDILIHEMAAFATAMSDIMYYYKDFVNDQLNGLSRRLLTLSITFTCLQLALHA